MTSLAFVVALATSPQSIQNRPTLLDVVRAVALFHQSDWRNIEPEMVEKALPAPWEQIDARFPDDSKYKTSNCDGSSYLKYDSERYAISFVFRRSGNTECHLFLSAIRISIADSLPNAASAHATLLSNLHAAGPVCDDDGHYRWRSDNSSVMYDLRVSMESEPGVAGLALWLTHTPVAPQARR